MVSAERLRDENSDFKYSDWNYEGGGACSLTARLKG